MKLNLTVKTTKNYQSIEISATDIEPAKYADTKMWLIKEAQIAIDQLEPGDNVTQGAPRKNSNQYQYNQQPKYTAAKAPSAASDKQKALLVDLGYNGDVNALTKDEAGQLIDQYFASRKNK